MRRLVSLANSQPLFAYLVAGSVALCLAASVALISLRFVALQGLADDQAGIARSYQLQKELGDVLSVFRSAEYLERSYLVTHNPQALKRFDAAVRQLPTEMAELQALIVGDPVYEPSYAILKRRLSARMAELQEEVLVGNWVAVGASMQVRDEEVAGILDRMQDEEERRINQRERHLYNGVATNLIFLVGITSLALISAAVLVGLLFRDLRRRVRAEAAMQQAKEAADAANVAKSMFLANISHEIRTPLNAIVGFSDLMLTPALAEPEKHEFAAIIRSNCQLLNQIIDDTLDLAKVEAGKLQIEPLVCSLSGVTRDLVAVLGKAAQEKGVVLTIRTEGGVPDQVVTDVTRVRQILFNVVGNAVKFTSVGSVTVVFRTQPAVGPGKSVRLSVLVTDTGQGISAEAQARLFQPFSQADVSTTRRFGGTGLGLVLSRQLARLLSGDVVLRTSQPGVGSEFEISLQADLPEGAAARAFTPPLAPAAPERLLVDARILVADDTVDSRILITQILKRSGAVVDVAENGQEAVALALSRRYDIVLMDLQMPVLDGFLATAELRRRGYSRPIVAVSAAAMREERERSAKAGCDLHISKPISRIELVAALARLRAGPERPAHNNA